MRTSTVLFRLALVLGTLGSGAVARAADAPPDYSDDPFGDNDFAGTPLIYDVAHPTKGRAEVGLLFASTVVDKYTSHVGAQLDLTYHLTETLGLGFAFSFLHGSLTAIVTEPAGIIDANVRECAQDPAKCDNITPDVPDYAQVTGSVDATVVWSPLYGKINVVSELDVNLQWYGFAGAGANGTRVVTAEADATAPLGYALVGDGIGEGGLFGDLKVHGVLGTGVKVHVLDWRALRGEFRGIMWPEKFAFSNDGVETTYLSPRWFLNFGANFTVF